MGYSSSLENRTEADSVAYLAQKAKEVQKFEVGGVEVFQTPSGNITALEELRPTPIRHKGQQKVADVESLLILIQRYKSPSQIVRMSISDLRIEAVFNYGTSERAEWGDHTASYDLHYDSKLKQWLNLADKPLTQTMFMEFLEERLEDVIDHDGKGPTQSALASVISDLQVTIDSKFQSARNLSNGNYVFACSSDTKASVEVPKEFFLALPVFEGSKERFIIPIRLRYRIKEGSLLFVILFHNWQAILDAAWKKVTEEIIAGLPEGVEHINVP